MTDNDPGFIAFDLAKAEEFSRKCRLRDERRRVDADEQAAERRGAVYALEWAWDEIRPFGLRCSNVDRESFVKEGMAALYPNETESV